VHVELASVLRIADADHPVHPEASLHMPKQADQKVLPSGMKTLPPAASASNKRRACASSSAVIDSVTPAKGTGSLLMPSDAMSSVSPVRKLQSMTLPSPSGGSGMCGGSRHYLKRSSTFSCASMARWQKAIASAQPPPNIR
jgi:hypothetical protein